MTHGPSVQIFEPVVDIAYSFYGTFIFTVTYFSLSCKPKHLRSIEEMLYATDRSVLEILDILLERIMFLLIEQLCVCLIFDLFSLV